jgi:uncharacterized protein YegJ (DUF2314 family)
MAKHRVCVVWFENGEPMERGFRVPYDDTWHERVRRFETKAIEMCDADEDVTVYSTSLDGETTEGFWVWDVLKTEYEYHELG